MTVAVFSDIHGNYHAFKACYEDAIKHGVEQYMFLGDYELFEKVNTNSNNAKEVFLCTKNV